MTEKKEEKVFCINVDNLHGTGNEKVKKFNEIAQAGKEKIKNYASEIDKGRCQKICLFLLKFIVFCVILASVIFLVLNIIGINDDRERMMSSIDSVKWDISDVREEVQENRRLFAGKFNEVTHKLKILSSFKLI